MTRAPPQRNPELSLIGIRDDGQAEPPWCRAATPPPCRPARKPRSALVPAVLNRRPSHGGPRIRIPLPPPACHVAAVLDADGRKAGDSRQPSEASAAEAGGLTMTFHRERLLLLRRDRRFESFLRRGVGRGYGLPL